MNATVESRIVKHGEALLRIFPGATIRDPVKLCKRLRRLERESSAIGLRMCNGPEYSDDELWAAKERVLTKVQTLLGYQTGSVPVFLNLDPRGYALKIDDSWMREREEYGLHRDWGGYGIIAPDLS